MIFAFKEFKPSLFDLSGLHRAGLLLAGLLALASCSR